MNIHAGLRKCLGHKYITDSYLNTIEGYWECPMCHGFIKHFNDKWSDFSKMCIKKEKTRLGTVLRFEGEPI